MSDTVLVHDLLGLAEPRNYSKSAPNAAANLIWNGRPWVLRKAARLDSWLILVPCLISDRGLNDQHDRGLNDQHGRGLNDQHDRD